ncbi:Amidohydrolase 3 [Allomuricauda ruestringensis DSM 13258]|uniref:Amidohydrolase 3 n=1 Tax=Allomuricauda ruestringensis (strain DSM 13258 / CIP 107369 / LMG 19739 / B1) TaxID=886377 RepID=G2PST4_ALLRU|nr:amidohydrolase [Allomuricauda ruestringensis]AEM69561.1 Amidohydrolase 3 [Allomuricauda ruestringensis DSM 13258]
MKKFFFLISLALVFSCTTKEEADLIVYNANIYTVDDAFSKVSSIAIKDGKFVAVGDTEEISKKYTAQKQLDAEGKTIVPGLIDAHCHFYGLGQNQQVVDLVGTQSFDEVVDRVVAFQEERPSNFILGRGWDQNDWEVKEFPTKDKLDELFPDTPIALERIDGHAYLVNQKALDLAGITADTETEGGEIVKEEGELTGVLVDNPMGLINKVMPPVSLEQKIQALKDAEKISLDYGLTTVNDAGLSRDIIELIDSLQQAGELSIRVYAMVSNYPENLDYFLEKGIIKTAGLNVRSVKVYGDGALGSRGAALRAPYSDKPGHFGAMVTPVDQIEALAQRIAETDYQMNTHAIGDSANIVVLRAYEKALEGKTDRRWKVEHAQVISQSDFDYFKNGIIPSVQPTHATSDMYWAADRLGAERVKGAYAFKDLLDKAGLVALGTDFPVEQVNPFLTFYAAVARQDVEQYPEGGFQIENALSREETLKGMTIWAAYSNFEEEEKGSIEPGKFADFVILSDDIMTITSEEIPNVTAEQVFLGGVRKK